MSNTLYPSIKRFYTTVSHKPAPATLQLAFEGTLTNHGNEDLDNLEQLPSSEQKLLQELNNFLSQLKTAGICYNDADLPIIELGSVPFVHKDVVEHENTGNTTITTRVKSQKVKPITFFLLQFLEQGCTITLPNATSTDIERLNRFLCKEGLEQSQQSISHENNSGNGLFQKIGI